MQISWAEGGKAPRHPSLPRAGSSPASLPLGFDFRACVVQDRE